MAEFEAEIKVRRNGRLVKMERALGDTAEAALYNVHNDFELWAQAETAHQRAVAVDGTGTVTPNV